VKRRARGMLVEDGRSEIGWFKVDEALTLDLAHPGYKDVLRCFLTPAEPG
jgi:hypothetical protein